MAKPAAATQRWTVPVDPQWIVGENVLVDVSRVHIDHSQAHGQIRGLDAGHVRRLVGEIIQTPLLVPHEVILVQRDAAGIL